MNNRSPVRFSQALSLVLLFVVVGTQDSVEGRLIPAISNKPHPNDAAAYARWLVSQNSWGVLSTISSGLGGAPFGNVVSFSDGLPNEGSGVPYFYLTTLDPTASNALKDKRSSLAISEYPLGTCGKRDPEDPVCAKITLTGKLVLVDVNSKAAEFARNALFAKHPEMKGWPKDHNFQTFKLEIDDIFLINWFGGPKPLTVDQYLHAKADKINITMRIVFGSFKNTVLTCFLNLEGAPQLQFDAYDQDGDACSIDCDWLFSKAFSIW